MEIDPLYEHPEDGGLEAEHEQGQHHVAQPGLPLVPGGVSPLIVVDVRLKIHDGCQVEKNQGKHEVLVDAETVTLEGSETEISKPVFVLHPPALHHTTSKIL